MKEEAQQDVAPVLDINRLAEMNEVLGISSSRLHFLSVIAQGIFRFTGLDPALRIPESFSLNRPEAWKALITIEKLKKLGWAQGVLQVTKLYHDEPKLFRSIVVNNDTPRNSGFGANFFSRDKALWASVGEAIERRALDTFEPQEWIDAPHSALRGKAVDPRTITGISPEKRAENPTLRFDDESIFRWIYGHSLVKNSPIAIPLQLASFKKSRSIVKKEEKEPLLRILVTTGAAAHTDRATAMLRGTLELIERDSFMITWMNMLAPDQIRLESIPNDQIQEILKSFKRYRLSVRLFHLPTDFSVHVVLAVLIDETGIGPFLVMGGSADFDLSRAIEKALSEAESCRLHTRRLVENKEHIILNFEDFSEMGQNERALYAARSQYADKISFLLKGTVCEYESFLLYPTQAASSKEQLHRLVREFREKNLELASVSLLTKEIEKELDFFAVIMVAPELQPMHLEESLPYNWGKRLDTVPKSLGLAVLREKNKIPHPFP